MSRNAGQVNAIKKKTSAATKKAVTASKKAAAVSKKAEEAALRKAAADQAAKEAQGSDEEVVEVNAVEAAKHSTQNHKKRKLEEDEDEDEDEDEEEEEEDDETDSEVISDIDKKLSELDKKQKALEKKEKELKKKEELLKAKPAKKGRKKLDEDDEKVECISIEYKIDAARSNAHLNNTFATVPLEDLFGFEEKFTKEDVSIF